MEAMASETRRRIRAACIATALTLLRFLASLLGDLTARLEREQRRETFQRELPNARQCRKCSYGPIDPVACWDLAAHNGERRGGARINNTCPICGWFDRDINNWPRWDGRLHDDPPRGQVRPPDPTRVERLIP